MNWKSGLGGAASGALAGSTFGPWGTAIGAGVGGIAGLMNDAGEAYDKAEKPVNAGYDEANRLQQPYNQNGMYQY